MAWSPSAATSPSGDDLYHVVRPHHAGHSGELQLEVGDVVTDCRNLCNDWTVGRCLNTNTLGIFPSDCLEPAQGEPRWEQQVGREREGEASKQAPRVCGEEPGEAAPVEEGSVQVIATPPRGRRNTPTPPKNITLTGAWSTPRSSRSTLPTNQSNRSTPPVNRSGRQTPSDVDAHHNSTDAYDVDSVSIVAPPSVGSSRGSLKQLGKPHMLVKPNRDTQAITPERKKPPKVPRRLTPQRTPPPAVRPRVVMSQSQSRPSTPELPHTANCSDTEVDAECRCRTPTQTDTPSTHHGCPQLSRAIAYSISISSLDHIASNADNSANEKIQRQNKQYTDDNGTDETDLGVSMVCYHDYRTLEYPVQQDARSLLQGQTPRVRRKPVMRNRNQSPSAGEHQHVYYRDKKRKNYTSQTMVSLFTGILLGFVTFAIMYFYLDYWIWVALGVSGATCLLLCIVFTMSRLCCCIAALVLPSTCTPAGRIAILILLSGLLLDGPITDIYRNMAEMSRSMGCSAEQSYNQSLLLLQPFDGMMDQLNDTITQLQYAATDVKHGLKTLDDHMDDVGKHVNNGHVQLMGAGRSCRVMVRQAFNECASGIEGAMNQCLDVMGALGTVYHHAKDVLDRINPDRWVSPRLQHLYKRQSEKDLPMPDEVAMTRNDKDICEPLDTEAVCQRLNDTNSLCQPSQWAGEAIHGAINATKEAMLKLKLTLKFSASTQPFYDTKVNTSRSIYLVKIKVQREFERQTQHFHFVISVLKKICPTAVLILIYVAYAYIKQYVSLDSYDNIYVTKRFRDLDQKRASATGESLLPLKKYERNYLIDTGVSERNQPEMGLGRVGMCVLTLHFLLTATCYMFNYVFYWVLGLIKTYGNPGVDVTGRTSLQEVIAGEGIIAELLEVFLNGFHPDTLFGYTIDPYTCLPRPHRPSLAYLLILSAIYIALFVLILTKAYTLRLRNTITGYFYGESEKIRIIYLYNRLLRQRTCMLYTLQRRARQNHQRRQRRRTVSMCHQTWCALCRVFLSPTMRCLVCGALEDHSFRDCDTEQCRGVYCAECFLDLGQQCPLCRPEENEDYEEVDTEDMPVYWGSNGIYL